MWPVACSDPENGLQEHSLYSEEERQRAITGGGT